MNLVAMHDTSYLREFRCRQHTFRFTRHDVPYGTVEELCLPFLHSASYVSVGDKSHHLAVLQRHSESQFSVAHVNYSLSQVHLLRYYRQFLRTHNVLCCCQQLFSQLTTRVELCEVSWFEVFLLHQRYSYSVAHHQLCRCAACRCQVQRTRLFLHLSINVYGRVFCQ